MHTVIFDIKLRRPACVLLQACFGGDSHIVSAMFNPNKWLLAPTPDLVKITGTREQWKELADTVNKA